ncbi:uncharacterized protein LOC111245532 isoform X1 [Varroa destructor]|uniref:Uncharacterized protein n=1 Tax=Varroa destructor TaxID=109461 RepID=A0A7M7JC89_VARDE|nr:uncharacterized protein LOC111245532 isoform X1 [Varroa destructor]
MVEMFRHHKLLILSSANRWSQAYLCLQFLLSGLVQGRVVVRGIAVLTADGFTISNKASPTVIPSNVGGIVDGVPALKSSFVLDCVYELVPSGGHDNSTLKNVSESMTLSPLSALAVSTVTSPRQIVSSVRQKGGNVTNVSDSTPFSSLDKKRTNSENRSVVPRVVKWFRNAESTPFYQWIPAARSRLFHHAYKDLLDPLYKHSDQPANMFRAVRIIRPVKELSGKFSCEVESDDVEENEVEEHEEQTATHELLIYDAPVDFELHLSLALRQLRCGAWTSEEPTSIAIKLFRQDYDMWQMPLGHRMDLNLTSKLSRSSQIPINGETSQTNPFEPLQGLRTRMISGNHGRLVRLEAIARLGAEDVKHLEIDTSRTFVCEISYNRLQRSFNIANLPNSHGLPKLALDHVFQRSVRILNESPLSNTDYENTVEGQNHEPFWRVWSAAVTSGAQSPSSSVPSQGETVTSLLLLVWCLHPL